MARTDTRIAPNHMYIDPNGKYKIRIRSGRKSLEVSFAREPGVWMSTGSDELDKAISKAEDMLVRSGSSVREITFGKFAENFFMRTDPESLQRRNAKFKRSYDINYYRSKQGYLNNYIMPKWGKYVLSEIRDREIENWYVNLTKGNRKDAPDLADNSKGKIVEAMGMILEEARKCGLISYNPCDRIEKIDEESKQREPFTEEELRKLFPHDKEEMIRIWLSEKWALYFSIMVDTGWRPGELLAIGRDTIYMGGIFSTRSFDSKARIVKESIKTTKKGRKYKVGILSDYSLQLMHSVLNQIPKSQNYLFMDEDGDFWSDGSANKHLRGACIRAKVAIGDRTQYCLRHTFETEMLKSLTEDLRMKDVAELMGHVGYRSDYDHTTPQDIIPRFMKAKDILNERRNAE